MKPSGLYGRPIFGGKKPQFYFQVTVTLCNIHHRPFFRPQSMSTGAGLSNIFVFLFVFYVLNVADFSKKTLELQKKKQKKPTLPPFFKTWIPSRPPVPLKLLGKFCKEEEAAVELCMQQIVLKSDTGVHNNAHFLSACHSHTQQRLKPQRDWMVLGIWHNTK